MKRFSLLLALLMSLSLAVNAKAAPDEPKEGEKKPAAEGDRRRAQDSPHEKALAKLDLTKEQKQKIQEIRKKAAEEMKKNREGDGEAADKRKKGREIAEKSRKDTIAILTEEQKTKYKELVAAFEKERKEKREKGADAEKKV